MYHLSTELSLLLAFLTALPFGMLGMLVASFVAERVALALGGPWQRADLTSVDAHPVTAPVSSAPCAPPSERPAPVVLGRYAPCRTVDAWLAPLDMVKVNLDRAEYLAVLDAIGTEWESDAGTLAGIMPADAHEATYRVMHPVGCACQSCSFMQTPYPGEPLDGWNN